MRYRALAVLVALALAAGCVGEDEAPIAEEVALATTTPPPPPDGPGALHGLVHTRALEPVANATVAHTRLDLSATTDAAGFFRLEGLAPGEHVLAVSAPGHVTRAVSVQARSGTTMEVDIALDIAPSTEPYQETRELRGFLSCALVLAGEARDCASADPNHRDLFEFELGGKGEQVVLELSWDPDATPAAPEMTLFAETAGYGAQDLDLGSATGGGYARLVVPATVMGKYYPEGGLMRARVALADAGTGAALATQTEFTVYVTVFYHEAGPEGFSVLQRA